MVGFFVLALNVNGELGVRHVGNSTSIPRTSPRMVLEMFDNRTPNTLPPQKATTRKAKGAGMKASAPRKAATSDDLLLVAGTRRHGALDHLFSSHGWRGHGPEEWPANGNRVPRLE